MKKLYFLFFLISTFYAVGQTNYLVENFNYPAGDNLTDYGWYEHSGAGSNIITVNDGGLLFTGYIGSAIGNAALVDNSGSDINKPLYEWITSGSVYTSFLVKANSTVTAANSGYFFHLGYYGDTVNPIYTSISSSFRARTFIGEGSDAGHFKLGLNFNSSTVTDLTGDLDVTQTYLVVIKYTFVDGTANDEVSMFVFSDGDNITTEPITPTIGPLTGTAADAPTIQNIVLRQFDSTENIIIDGFYVRTEWNMVDPGTSLCPIALGEGTANCNSNTLGNDNDSVTINIPYTSSSAGITSLTTTSGGTIGGDDPASVANGTITITGLSEGDTWDITLNGGQCDGTTTSGTVPSAECDPRYLLINEILADPAADAADGPPIEGDANGDGVRDSSDDEFVEIYNTDSNPINLEGYTLSDAAQVRHVFPANSILATNNFMVVFGGGTPTGIGDVGSVVQIASSTALGFNNGGDVVTLKDPFGTIVAQYAYGAEGGNDESLARNPDFTGAFVLHTSIVSNPVAFSPGFKNDGSTLSVNSFSKSELSIFPNPVSKGSVTIKSQLSGIKDVQLYDIMGRQVLNTKLTSDVLDVSSVRSGLYLLRVSIDDRSSTTKLIIK